MSSANGGQIESQTPEQISLRLQSIEPDAERHRRFANKITGGGRSLTGETGDVEADDDDDEEDGNGDDGDAIDVEEEPKPKGKAAKSGKIKYTPLEQQFMEVKAKFPDTVLFVEAGYRYRFFGKDAEVAAKVLGIHAGWSHNFLSTSIPTHRLHVHSRRIVQAGYKVGVVSQTETAALKKIGSNKSGPFTRALTGLYTRGTMVGGEIDPLLTGDLYVGNYLLGIFDEPSVDPTRVNIAVAAIKTSTGDIVWDGFEDGFLRTELETRLRHLSPVEIIYPTSLSDPSKRLLRVFQVESQAKDAAAQARSVSLEEISHARFHEDELFKASHSSEGASRFLRSFPKSLTRCLGGLANYLKDFNLSSLFALECNYIHFSETSRMRLDGKTLENLELLRNQTTGSDRGSLLGILDRTRSIFGKRLLTRWLQQPLTDIGYVSSTPPRPLFLLPPLILIVLF